MSDPGDLANLADLVLPPPVPFWPPAAGVWIVSAAALAALAVLGRRVLRRYRADAYLRAAKAELDALATGEVREGPAIAERVSAVMKRAAIVAYGRERVAALTGAEWSRFIEETAPPATRTDAIASSLNAAFATPERSPAPDRDLLIAQARGWLGGQRGRAAAEA